LIKKSFPIHDSLFLILLLTLIVKKLLQAYPEFAANFIGNVTNDSVFFISGKMQIASPNLRTGIEIYSWLCRIGKIHGIPMDQCAAPPSESIPSDQIFMEEIIFRFR